MTVLEVLSAIGQLMLLSVGTWVTTKWVIKGLFASPKQPENRFYAWLHRKRNRDHVYISTKDARSCTLGAACVKCDIIFYGDAHFRKTYRDFREATRGV